jgi:hypothetical protein
MVALPSYKSHLETFTFKLVAVIIFKRNNMGRGVLPWLLGAPIPIIILLALFYR